MREFSFRRARLFTLMVGAAGTLATFALRDVRDAGGFVAGAAMAWVSVHSWVRLSEALASENQRPGGVWGVFLALRYVVMGSLVYGIVKVLGSSPVATIAGLLASFAAVVLELLYDFMGRDKGKL